MNLIWASRGRTWGFRFLRTGGFTNPLEVYENAFAGTGGAPEVYAAGATTVAVRFPDPEGRTDRAGRVIPHEFVVLTPDDVTFTDLNQAREALWQEVGEQYAAAWEQPSPPAADELR